MLLPRRTLTSMRRVYGRLLLCGVCFTLLLLLIFKAQQNAAKLDPDAAAEPLSLLADHGPAAERYEREVLRDLAMQRPGLGDNGEAVQLEGAEEARGEQDLAKIALNEEVSRHLSYNRSTPDGRNPHCKRLRYDTAKLPSAAVIIIFFDEPYSVILRTVHSVLNTAGENLKEVVLVDDASTHEELQGKLDHYVATRLPRSVKLLRMKSR